MKQAETRRQLLAGGVGALAVMGVGRAMAKRPSRVAAAEERLRTILPARFTDVGLRWPPKQVFLRVTKHQGPKDAASDAQPGHLELWASDDAKGPVTLVHRYPVCALSGRLGPKRREGDLQIPEGFYEISALNPTSSYHLSLRVDYPNASDRIRGRAPRSSSSGEDHRRLGGDIMVHGDCVTIGCVPIEDEPIEEVYLAVDVVHGRRAVPIHIFPCPLDSDEALAALLAANPKADDDTTTLWRELRVGWAAFAATKTVPKVRFGAKGEAIIT